MGFLGPRGRAGANRRARGSGDVWGDPDDRLRGVVHTVSRAGSVGECDTGRVAPSPVPSGPGDNTGRDRRSHLLNRLRPRVIRPNADGTASLALSAGRDRRGEAEGVREGATVTNGLPTARLDRGDSVAVGVNSLVWNEWAAPREYGDALGVSRGMRATGGGVTIDSFSTSRVASRGPPVPITGVSDTEMDKGTSHWDRRRPGGPAEGTPPGKNPTAGPVPPSSTPTPAPSTTTREPL